MTVERFKEIMEYNEPDFGYRGEEYSICWPNGVYYVTASDLPRHSGPDTTADAAARS